MKNTTYFVYAIIALLVGLVYLFGELKHHKTIGKTKELWLLEDTSELEDKIKGLEATVNVLAKQNKEYEIILAVIKLKLAENKEPTSKDVIKEKKEPVKPSTQSTTPKLLEPGYPGNYIPKGQIPPGSQILEI